MTRDGIFQLEQEEGIIEGGENLKKFITKYYKGLFGPQKRNNFSMDEIQNRGYFSSVTC